LKCPKIYEKSLEFLVEIWGAAGRANVNRIFCIAKQIANDKIYTMFEKNSHVEHSL